MNVLKDVRQMRALADMEEDAPEHTREVLCDSGFGELADDWLQAEQEFSRAAQSAGQGGDEADTRSGVVRAYARLCVSWARISQLRDQARRSMEAPQ